MKANNANRSINNLFFQAEDGIRFGHVTGVQTCALPILGANGAPNPGSPNYRAMSITVADAQAAGGAILPGDIVDVQIGRASCRKECRSWWTTKHVKKKETRG